MYLQPPSPPVAPPLSLFWVVAASLTRLFHEDLPIATSGTSGRNFDDDRFKSRDSEQEKKEGASFSKSCL